jgi:hypothetical protein
MGMFDYFEIDVSLLPFVPSELKAKENGCVSFQTKDTCQLALATYFQHVDSRLVLKQTTGKWIPGETTAADASIGEKLAALGSYVVTDTWYEEQHINDVIEFYTNLQHKDDDGSDRYVDGWIEYVANYRDGLPTSIAVFDHRDPRKLSDKEVIETRESLEHARSETQKKLVTRRIEHPTHEERLIDSITEIAENRVTLYDEADLMHALNRITKLIEEYRERHDIHYRTPKRKAL